MRRSEEHDNQVLLMQRIALDPRTRDLLMTAIPNGGQRHPAVAGKLKAEGVRKGVPDILVFEKSAVFAPTAGGAYLQYAGLAIEMKIKPNTTTPEQREWLARLNANGWRATVAYSADEAFDILLQYLGLQKSS